MQNKMTVEEAVDQLKLFLKTIEGKYHECNEEAINILISYSQKQECGELKPDEDTLYFFRRYLDMPEGTLEDMCREILRLKERQKQECVGADEIEKLFEGYEQIEFEGRTVLAIGADEIAEAIASLGITKKASEKDLQECVVQVYCLPKHSKKVVDPELVVDIAKSLNDKFFK